MERVTGGRAVKSRLWLMWICMEAYVEERDRAHVELGGKTSENEVI